MYYRLFIDVFVEILYLIQTYLILFNKSHLLTSAKLQSLPLKKGGKFPKAKWIYVPTFKFMFT